MDPFFWRSLGMDPDRMCILKKNIHVIDNIHDWTEFYDKLSLFKT